MSQEITNNETMTEDVTEVMKVRREKLAELIKEMKAEFKNWTEKN